MGTTVGTAGTVGSGAAVGTTVGTAGAVGSGAAVGGALAAGSGAGIVSAGEVVGALAWGAALPPHAVKPSTTRQQIEQIAFRTDALSQLHLTPLGDKRQPRPSFRS